MIDVRGVLISWETFVMSSVFILSLLSLSSSAIFWAAAMLLRFTACLFNSGSIHFVFITWSKCPAESSCAPFLILSSWSVIRISKGKTTNSTTQKRKPSNALLGSAIAPIHKIITAANANMTFHKSFMFVKIVHMNLPTALMPFQRNLIIM